MARKNRGHRAPPQSRAIPPGAVDLNQREQQQKAQQAHHEQQIRMRVEGVAAQIYTDGVSQIVGCECSGEEFEELCQNICNRSIDAALLLGRELWGIQATRQKPAKKPKRRPRVLQEDIDVPDTPEEGDEES